MFWKLYPISFLEILQKYLAKKNTIEGLIKLDYKWSDNSLFGVTVICSCKCKNSFIIDDFSIIRIDIYNFANFTIRILEN